MSANQCEHLSGVYLFISFSQVWFLPAINPLGDQITAVDLIVNPVIIKIFSPTLRFIFTSWLVFFSNVFSKRTCPRLVAAGAEGAALNEWEPFIAVSGLPHFLISSPLHTLSPGYYLSSLYTLPTLRPKGDRQSWDCLFIPGQVCVLPHWYWLFLFNLPRICCIKSN